MEKNFKSPVSTISPRGQRVENVHLIPRKMRENDTSKRAENAQQIGTVTHIPAQSGKVIPSGALSVEFQQRFWGKVNRPDGCWEWTGGRDHHGYGKVRMPMSRVQFRAHRVAYFLATGEDPGSHLVCHRCDNPSCVNPAHLFLGTPADNVTDMLAKGRHKTIGRKGAHNPGAKLTDADVRRVVDLLLAGAKNTEIAEKVGVTHAMVSRIRLGKSWGDFTRQLGYVPTASWQAPKSGKTGAKKSYA